MSEHTVPMPLGTEERMGSVNVIVLWYPNQKEGDQVRVHMGTGGLWPNGSVGSGLIVTALEKALHFFQNRHHNIQVEEEIAARSAAAAASAAKDKVVN